MNGLAREILLAEDNAVNQRLAIRLLEKRGHRVTLAQNGREALTAWSQGSFDFILMDVQMPIMSGHEATMAIREREQMTGGHIPIVALTAHAMKGDEDLCHAAGMDYYLTKPIKAEALFSLIDSIPARANNSQIHEAA
jgi:CheY-like chemotaxis protein